jgi:heptose I phosphotransferase
LEQSVSELYLREDLARVWRGADPFEQVAQLRGEVYRAVANRRTLRFEADGHGYFAKIHWDPGWAEIAKNLLTLRLPVVGARNEFEACRHLARVGIRAPTVAAFGERGRNPARRFSFVVCDALEDRVSLEDVVARWQERAPTAAQKRRLIDAVADFARALHGAGVVHRDFYVCHLLLDRAAWADGRVELAVIDLHRAQLHARIPRRWRRRDLAALLFSVLDAPLTRHDRLRFIARYRGRPLRAVLDDERAFWLSVYRRAKALHRKGRRKGLLTGRWLLERP